MSRAAQLHKYGTLLELGEGESNGTRMTIWTHKQTSQEGKGVTAKGTRALSSSAAAMETINFNRKSFIPTNINNILQNVIWRGKQTFNLFCP